MNVKALRQVKKVILAVPGRLDMTRWGVKVPKLTLNAHPGYKRLLLYHEFLNRMAFADSEAREFLKLSPEQADRLFHVDDWPEKFAERYRVAEYDGDHKAMAEVTAARIEHFIKTKGDE